MIIKGNSKQQVGEIAAVIRKQRPPEPYKGKGIRYEGEYVARKVGRGHDGQDRPPSASSAAVASARRSPAAPSVPGSPSSARIAASSPRSSTTGRAARWPPSTGPRTTSSAAPHGAGARAGELLAERAKAAGVENAVFDRGGYQYHGRVKALAEGAREGGLIF